MRPLWVVLSGLGAFYEKGAFNDKTNVIIWVSTRGIFKAYSKSVRIAECICLILSLMWLNNALGSHWFILPSSKCLSPEIGTVCSFWYPCFDPKAIPVAERHAHFLPTPCPAVISVFCFLLALMLKEFFSLPISRCWGKGERIAVLSLPICKLFLPQFPKLFKEWGKRGCGSEKSFVCHAVW